MNWVEYDSPHVNLNNKFDWILVCLTWIELNFGESHVDWIKILWVPCIFGRILMSLIHIGLNLVGCRFGWMERCERRKGEESNFFVLKFEVYFSFFFFFCKIGYFIVDKKTPISNNNKRQPKVQKRKAILQQHLKSTQWVGKRSHPLKKISSRKTKLC